MYGTKTLTQVGALLGVTKGQIEQWVARGQFIAPTALRGKAREWEFWDVLRLAVFVRLTTEVGMSARESGLATLMAMNSPEGEPSFFVAWTGEFETQVIGGNPGDKAWHRADAPFGSVVPASQLGDFLVNTHVYWSVVLPLSRIEAALDAVWALSFEQPTTVWDLLG